MIYVRMAALIEKLVQSSSTILTQREVLALEKMLEAVSRRENDDSNTPE